MRSGGTLVFGVVAIGLAGWVGGCAGPSTRPSDSAATPNASASAISESIFVAGAIPAAKAGAVVDALQSDLVKRLKPEASAGVIGVLRRPDGAPRLLIETGASFEAGSAQMRAETLLRLAECAVAVQSAGAFVVQVVGYGEPALTPDGESLAERRATTVASYLLSRGLSATRVRAEGRVSRDRQASRRIELVFEPIVEGREVRAWMPPS